MNPFWLNALSCLVISWNIVYFATAIRGFKSFKSYKNRPIIKKLDRLFMVLDRLDLSKDLYFVIFQPHTLIFFLIFANSVTIPFWLIFWEADGLAFQAFIGKEIDDPNFS